MAKRKHFTREDLNEKQSAWLDAYIEGGATRNAATQAVKMVYGYNDNAASTHAGRMLKNEKIRDVLVEEVGASFAATAVLAAERLAEILTTGMFFGQAVKPSDGMKAIREGLDRGIGPLAHIQKIHMEHDIGPNSVKELRAAILGELGKLPETERRAFLSQMNPGGVIDAEYEEIDPAAPWGYKSDGTPKKKPGAHITKRYLPGPEATKPATISNRIDKLRKRAAERVKEKANGTSS